MNRSKYAFIIPLILIALAFYWLLLYTGSQGRLEAAEKDASTLPKCCGEHQHQMIIAKADKAGQEAVFAAMPDPGKKVLIGNDSHLIYGFDQKPKMGTVIMKVQVFNGNGEKDTSLEVLADSGMPSMRGAHETGDQPLKLSRKGDYLLPVNIVMPGDWEIRLTIKKGDKVVFRGRYNFNV